MTECPLCQTACPPDARFCPKCGHALAVATPPLLDTEPMPAALPPQAATSPAAVTQPRLVFMDEPTSGLDVSVQARLLDMLRQLTRQMQLAAIIVTHDLAVARLLAHRMVVMQRGRVVESGLTDQVLDDPQHPYTQLLVSSVLQP